MEQVGLAMSRANEKTSGMPTGSYLPNCCIKELEGRLVSGDECMHPEKDSRSKSRRPWDSGSRANQNILR
jgi:hypothetical protein